MGIASQALWIPQILFILLLVHHGHPEQCLSCEDLFHKVDAAACPKSANDCGTCVEGYKAVKKLSGGYEDFCTWDQQIAYSAPTIELSKKGLENQIESMEMSPNYNSHDSYEQLEPHHKRALLSGSQPSKSGDGNIKKASSSSAEERKPRPPIIHPGGSHGKVSKAVWIPVLVGLLIFAAIVIGVAIWWYLRQKRRASRVQSGVGGKQHSGEEVELRQRLRPPPE